MSYDENDLAYDEYLHDEYERMVREDAIREFKDGALVRLRDAILSRSTDHASLVESELRYAEELLVGEYLAAAFFHAYRAIDGYLHAVLIGPITEMLMEPLTPILKGWMPLPLEMLQSRFIRNLRDQLLTSLPGGDEITVQVRRFDALSSLRNKTFHGFVTPSVQDIEECSALALRIVNGLEAVRS